MKSNVSFGGEWKLKILDAGGNLKRETDWFDNLVTNVGLDTIGSGGTIGTYCRIGTGSTTPSYADTQLVSQSAATNTVIATSGTNVGSATYVTQQNTTYQFALGAVVGNMAEIGVGTTASTASTLCTRALIVDGGGSPTTITVLSSEILQCIYRFSVYPNLVDATGSVTIQGVSYSYVARQVNVGTTLSASPSVGAFISTAQVFNAYNGAIGATTAATPAGTAAAFTSGVLSAYTSGNYYRDVTLTAGLSDANVSGGITAIMLVLGGGGAVFQTQISFSPAIPKDSTKQLTIIFRQFFSHH